jgi:hypothetical protein
LHPGGGPVYPGQPSQLPYPTAGGGDFPSHPITLPPGASIPPEEIWPPAKPAAPGAPSNPSVVPPDKVAVFIFVPGIGQKWMIVDKPAIDAKPPDAKPPAGQPK